MNIDFENDPELVRLDKELENDWKKQLRNIQKRKLIYDHRIQSQRSKFSKKLFDKYDIPARQKLKEVLGDFIEDNPDQYKQDFIIKSDICKYKYLEVQVCAGWINEKYPMDTLWVYSRKSVYPSDTLFITLSKNLKYGYIFDADSFKDVKPRRLKKYSREMVYDIPWGRLMKIFIETLDKETIELY